MPRPAIKDMDLLFFDSETSGLSASKHSLIEVAAIRTDPSGTTVKEEYCTKIYPVGPVDPEAAKINGYTPEKWELVAIPADTAIIKILDMARNALLVGHNISFDFGFLEMAMLRRGARWTGSYHKMCTMSLSTPLLKAGIVPNIKLTTLTEYFGIEHMNAHSALADVRACRDVYLKLMEIYRPAVQKYQEGLFKEEVNEAV